MALPRFRQGEAADKEAAKFVESLTPKSALYKN